MRTALGIEIILLSHSWVSEGGRNTGAIKCKRPCDFMIRFCTMIVASCYLMDRFSFNLSQWVFPADFSVIDSQLALLLFDDFRFYIVSCQLVFQQVLGDPSKRPIGFYHLVSYFISFLYFRVLEFMNNNFSFPSVDSGKSYNKF